MKGGIFLKMLYSLDLIPRAQTPHKSVQLHTHKKHKTQRTYYNMSTNLSLGNNIKWFFFILMYFLTFKMNIYPI